MYPGRPKRDSVGQEVYPDFGASLASMAHSSPIEVRTMTSRHISRSFGFPLEETLTSILLILAEELIDFIANLAVRHLDIVFGVASISHQGKEAVLGNVELYSQSA